MDDDLEKRVADLEEAVTDLAKQFNQLASHLIEALNAFAALKASFEPAITEAVRPILERIRASSESVERIEKFVELVGPMIKRRN